MKKIAFLIPPTVQILDLASPLAVFTHAKEMGLNIEIELLSYTDSNTSTSGLSFLKLKNYEQATLKEGDYLFISSMERNYVQSFDFNKQKDYFNWLNECSEKKVNICATCNGVFSLGKAGLLNNISCVTHWLSIDELQLEFPKAKIRKDLLFIKSGNIYTSAGVSTGIDLALSIIEEIKGPLFTFKLARGLIIYQRRSGTHTQKSIYLDYRNHINPKIHEVQDYLIDNISKPTTIEELSSIVAMSSRNLSRVFKEKTGTTIGEFHTLLRIELAKTMINNPNYTIEFIASKCGFKSARQLQRILKKQNVPTDDLIFS